MDTASVVLIAVLWLMTIVAVALWMKTKEGYRIDEVIHSKNSLWKDRINDDYVLASSLPEGITTSKKHWTVTFDLDRWGDTEFTVNAGDQEIDMSRPEVIIAMVNAVNRYYRLTGDKQCLSID